MGVSGRGVREADGGRSVRKRIGFVVGAGCLVALSACAQHYEQVHPTSAKKPPDCVQVEHVGPNGRVPYGIYCRTPDPRR